MLRCSRILVTRRRRFPQASRGRAASHSENARRLDARRRRGGASKYDWPRWLKGDIWEIRRGEDYDVPTENMRVTLHAKADQKGLKVRTRKVPAQGEPERGEWEGLVFQFYDPEDQEG